MITDKKYLFCIVTYETLPNPITQNLKTFLIENYKCEVLYIYHPMLDIKEGYQMASGYNLFKDKKLVLSYHAYHWKLYWPILYIKDVLCTLFWCLKFKKKFDVYFACGNLNPVAGLILRKIGVVKKVVFLTLDYYPIRFKNTFLNWFYFQLDKFCVRFSDETWNVSPAIAKAREKKMDMKESVYSRQYIVRGGIWFYKTKRLPFAKINRKKIVYRGMLLPHMGVDLVIKAMSLILQKIPDLIFEIVGTGEDEQRLKELANDLSVSKNILFHGYVKSREKMKKILSNGALGVATFNKEVLDNKNSDPGKIKDYMLLGMPVVTTNSSYVNKEISENKCGYVIPYDSEELAKVVIQLLKNKVLLKRYRQNAIKFIKNFDCINILRPNVERVLNESNY